MINYETLEEEDNFIGIHSGYKFFSVDWSDICGDCVLVFTEKRNGKRYGLIGNKIESTLRQILRSL